MARLLLALRDPLMTIALDARNAPLPPQTGHIEMSYFAYFDKASLRREIGHYTGQLSPGLYPRDRGSMIKKLEFIKKY